jgi:error-prone DNA polymerase
MGLAYARGLRREAGEAIARARSVAKFTSVYDLAQRVPELRRKELVMLAQIGALNSLGENIHRRDAIWQAEFAGRPSGDLFNDVPEEQEYWKSTPLFQMTTEERLAADYQGTGVTVGPHPMAYHRRRLAGAGVTTASALRRVPNGQIARMAGFVISRQRPGTAKGFFFLSIEDETGVFRAIFEPDLFDQYEALWSHGKFLQIEGILQNQDNDISLKAFAVMPLCQCSSCAIARLPLNRAFPTPNLSCCSPLSGYLSSVTIRSAPSAVASGIRFSDVYQDTSCFTELARCGD